MDCCWSDRKLVLRVTQWPVRKPAPCGLFFACRVRVQGVAHYHAATLNPLPPWRLKKAHNSSLVWRLSSMLQMKTDLAAQLRHEEGAVPHAYQDHLGYWTIGVGRLIDKRKGGGLTPDEVDYLLANDIERKTREVFTALPWAHYLDDARQAVLIGMAFQMGATGLLGFKNTLAHVKAGRYTQAAAGMLASKWAEQTPGRAARMARQMETGEWQMRPTGE